MKFSLSLPAASSALCQDKPAFQKAFLTSHHYTRYSISLLFALFSFMGMNAATKTSTGSGNWSAAGSWSPSGVPANGDAVIIQAGHTITVNGNTNNLLSLTINGTLTIGNNNTDRTVTVTGNITVSSTGTFNTAGNGGNELYIGGNLINNGIFDMNIGGATADVIFNGAANQSVSGTGTTTDVDVIIVNNTGAANNNIVEVMPSGFTANAGFLTLTDGILKMSGSYTLSNTFFTSASTTINSDEGIWLNNSNVTVTAQGGSLTLAGLFRVTAGTFNIGNAADNSLVYTSGAVITIEGGSVNIAGALRCSASSSTVNYTQSSGTVTVNTVNNTSSSYGSFDIHATGASFTMSGGSIILQKAVTALIADFLNNSGTSSVTGGTIQFGNASTPASSVYWMSSTSSLYNLNISSTNSPVVRLRSDITVLNDVTISSSLDAGTYGYNMFVGHDWVNNSSFTQGSATVTFNGTTSQQIGGSTATTFYNFTVNKSAGGVTLSKPTTIQGAGTFTAGIVTSNSTNLLIFADNATTTGANNNTTPSYVDGPVRKIGDDVFIFPIGKTGVGYMSCGISNPASTTDAFTAEYKRSSATALGPITASGLYRVSACEYWQLDRTTGSSSVNVTLSWSGLSPCNASAYVTSLANLTVAHFNGTSWDTHGVTSYTGNASSGTITRNGVSVFSPFSIGSTSATTNPLPIKFSAVKAYTVSNGNRVEWTNMTEENLTGYEVERSSNGISFHTIISVLPKTNNGQENKYTKTDENMLDGINYYRIKAIQTDGSYEYSAIVKVVPSTTAERSISVYPNPVISGQFTVQLNNYIRGEYSVKLMNSNGQQVMLKKIQHGGGSVSITIEKPQTIQPGLYILQVRGETEDSNIKVMIR
jgi:hypothetical protein